MRDTLRKNNVQYRALVESQLDLISRYLPDTTLTFANDAYCKFYGKTRDELIGQSFLNLIAPEFREQVLKETANFLKDPSPVGGEYLNYRWDGKECWIHWVIQGIVDGNGRVVELQAIGRDITPLKQAEEALREKSDELDKFFSDALDLLCIADTDGRFVRLNAEWERSLGYTLSELEGRSFLDLVHPEDQTATLDALSTLKEGDDVLNFTNRYRCKDGSYRWIEWRSLPSGNLIYAAARDITIRKQIEDSLRINEERLQQAIRLTSTGIFDHDHANDFIYWSPEIRKAFGIGLDEAFTLQDFLGYIHPDDLKKLGMAIQQAHNPDGDGLFDVEYRFVRQDGTICWFAAKSRTFFGGDGETKRPIRTVGALIDITERKQAVAEIHRRAEEVALLYRLGSALSSEGNLYQAMRAFIRELKHVMTVDAFHIGMYDEKTDIFSYSLFLNLDEDLYPPPRKLREKPGLTWEVISTRKTLYIPDVTDPQARREHEVYQVVDAPIRTYLGIPLILQNRVIGIISVQSIRTEAYTPEQIRLLETIAAQVALTIEKLSLLEQVQKELAERKRAEAEIQQRETILEVVAEAANTFLKVSEWNAETWRMEVDNLLEKLGNTIHASHAYIFENHLDKDSSIKMSLRYEWTSPGLVSDLDNSKYANMPLKVGDLESWNNTILRGLPYIGDLEHLSPADMDSLHQRGIHALLDVPIFIDGKWWGTIGFDEMSKPRNWSAAEVDALVVAANLVGAAVKRRQMDSILRDELQQKKKLIEELENKNAELERFTYTVSHDLKSPLVTIKGFLGFLKKDLAAGNMERFYSDIERISSATQKMEQLLRDLLEISRIGRLIHPPEDIPFESLVKEALELVHGRLEAGGITVHIQPNLPVIYGDRPRLVEVLQNLIDNAAMYMGNQVKPLVEIGQRGEENGRLVFYVKDNGMGIAPEHHERVFGLFNKLDAKSEGTGVGLALVKRILEFHECRIWVESEPGKGSTFLFTLPMSSHNTPESKG